MMTTIGILGTGRMAVRLAVEFTKLGHGVVLGSRTPERATHITIGLDQQGIRPGDYHAAAACEVVLPAMFLRDGLLEALRPGPAHQNLALARTFRR
jgi:predicted dinucleotide-binding enzyme